MGDVHYFLLHKKEHSKDKSLQSFVQQHPFLPLYALFLLFGKKEKTFDWQQWPASLQNLSKEKIAPLLDQYQEDLLFTYFLQYLAFSQMRSVKAYATQKNIQLLGDLPILTSPHSTDVYWHSSLFNLKYSAGAPPDDFNLKGQKWNFPLFNWDAMKFDTLKELGICGIRVMRWFLKTKLDAYDPLSITTLSTHDTETLQEWWENHPNDAHILAQEKHWSYAPKLTLEERKCLLFDSHHTSSLFHINLLQEYLALFEELIWGSPEKKRINIPGKVLKSNWCYRFRPSIEELAQHSALKKVIREILSSESSR